MKRTLTFATAGLAALLAAGLAVAALGEPETTKVAPSFTLKATAAESEKCAGADGEYTSDELVAEGRIGSGPLAGDATLELAWVKNVKENVGFAEGTLVVTSDEDERVRADVVGAVTGTTMRGTVSGDVGIEEPQRLVGTITVIRNGASLAVKIGNGAVAGAAVLFGGEPCVAPQTATGVVVDIDLESAYLAIETDEGDYVSVSLTEKQSSELADVELGDTVTITYREDDDGNVELVNLTRG
jgi:hypothetical protein